MIHLLSTGSYSDYEIVALLEGPKDLDLKKLNKEFTDLVKQKIGMECPKINAVTEHGSPQYREWRIKWDAYYKKVEAAFEELGNDTVRTEAFVNWLNKHYSVTRVEYKEHELVGDY